MTTGLLTVKSEFAAASVPLAAVNGTCPVLTALPKAPPPLTRRGLAIA